MIVWVFKALYRAVGQRDSADAGGLFGLGAGGAEDLGEGRFCGCGVLSAWVCGGGAR